jgi:hypothetical protein
MNCFLTEISQPKIRLPAKAVPPRPLTFLTHSFSFKNAAKQAKKPVSPHRISQLAVNWLTVQAVPLLTKFAGAA